MSIYFRDFPEKNEEVLHASVQGYHLDVRTVMRDEIPRIEGEGREGDGKGGLEKKLHWDRPVELIHEDRELVDVDIVGKEDCDVLGDLVCMGH